jgi:hypothetical protein
MSLCLFCTDFHLGHYCYMATKVAVMLGSTANFCLRVIRLIKKIRPMLFYQLNLTTLIGRYISAHSVFVFQLGPYRRLAGQRVKPLSPTTSRTFWVWRVAVGRIWIGRVRWVALGTDRKTKNEPARGKISDPERDTAFGDIPVEGNVRAGVAEVVVSIENGSDDQYGKTR